MQDFVINKDNTENNSNAHEIHTLKHAKQLGITNFKYVGYYETCDEALKEARKFFVDAAYCAICCPPYEKK